MPISPASVALIHKDNNSTNTQQQAASVRWRSLGVRDYVCLSVMKPGTTFDIIPRVMPATNQCSICLGEMKASIGMLGGCEHIFCYDCIKKWSEAKRTCPIDRTPFDSINILHEIGGAIVEEEKLEPLESDQLYTSLNGVRNFICPQCGNRLRRMN
ncbi:unnamed protein product [Rodentolepis nana]|uniref:RING-type domain-containing protein n=1 Tax=Rodentolepis nana TaxID=102285 RepID=A0A0R3TWZ9_RODNA|nr:unnamed protein product [Rodentolepis nana]